ncbi:inactive serine protease scarface [Contarinia nasturtii]|uniref:inactive serine protease scarface n=1 Tax=Contarinia nasturtii TaxID=265458 RepID=UPI0012D40326|nr:inactive serine protease scarface [Contarinia nasturtii]
MNVCIALVGLFLIGAQCAEKEDFEKIVANSNVFGKGDDKFWWMSQGSPFKRAAAYHAAPQQQFNFDANPFLRSNRQAASNAKLYSAPGYLPPEPQKPQTVPCQGNGRVCVPKYQCQGGSVDASQVSGQNSQECNVDSEVCCQVRQPTPAPTRPTPPPSRPTYIPPAPPTPARQLPTPCNDRNSVCAPANQCYNGAVSRGSPYASRAPASQCLAPEVCCRVPEEPRPNPSVTVVSYQPSPTTPRPVVITKSPPRVNNAYLPPQDNQVGQGSNQVGVVNNYLPPPSGGEDQKSPSIPDYSGSSSNNRPTINQQDAAPQLPPTACPAATNCTDIQYCAADGTMSTSPVTLTSEQETYRVPLSPCRDESKGISQGVCCRDPNYTDPWPTDLLRTGAFDANALAQAFDDGQYRPNNGNNGNGRNQRGEALKSPKINPINPIHPIHTASSEQTKQYTNAPFITNAIPNNNQPIKTSVSQQSPNPNKFQPNQQTFSTPSQFNTPTQQQPHSKQPQFVPQNQQAFSQPPYAQASTNQKFATTPSFPTPPPVSQQYKEPGQPSTPAIQQQQTYQPNQPQTYPPQSQSRGFTPDQPSAFQQPQQPQKPNQHFQPPQQQAFTPAQPSFTTTQNFQPQQPQAFQPQSQPQQPAFQPSTPSQNPFQTSAPVHGNQIGTCAVRDQLGLPRGNAPNEAAFGEFPWQAMILRESTKTILCGGAIIDRNVVATAAHCVDGLRTHDVLIKAGEWKLGSTEEPKPFQTVRVKQITMHPAYQPTNLESDVALLHLENDLKYDKHIGPICVDESELEPTQGSDEECVTSGWGKEQIKYHVAGSLPHSVAINPLSADECQSSLGTFNANTAVCGRAQGNPCEVDNGSALACTRGNGRYLLKGIYSGETGCGPNQVMSFTKMDVDFIKGGSAQKSLPIQPNTRGSFNALQQEQTKAAFTASARGLKKYLPPN